MPNALKISIKWKIFALVAVMITGAIFFIVLRTNAIFRQDKEAFVKELSAKLASSTAKNLSNRIATLQDKLIIFISSRESLAHTGAKVDDQLQVLFSRYQEFNSIGFLTSDASGGLVTDWVVRNPQGGAAQWPADFEKSFLNTLNTKKALANGRGFWKAKSPSGEWLAILGFSVQVVDNKAAAPKTNSPGAPTTQGVANQMAAQAPGPAHKTAWIIGVMPSTAFDDLFNDFSTGLNSGYLIDDDDGVALANSDSTSRWKNLSSEPIVEEVVKTQKPAATGDFVDGNGRAIIGSFEQIYKMNLTAIVTTPRDKAFQAADELAHSILTIGLVILLMALAIAVLFSNYLTGPLQKLAAIAERIGAGDFKVPIDVQTNDEIGQLAGSFHKMEQGLNERDEALAAAQTSLIQSEKMGAFGQLSAGIAHEVKNPLAGILGHAQLAMGKIQNDDIKKHLEVIEKETRRCKTIVENLMKFARAEKAELKPTDLAQVCQDTINLVDHQLSLAGCKIFKDFKACPLVEANANQLQQVLLNLMVNASHAMENSPTKNVIVRVIQVGTKAQIQIQDTGSGIPPEIQKKIFEPFFTTKPAGKGTGLGLSVSIGIVKDHKGEISLKSEANKGTTFFIDIPIAEGAKMPTQPLENTHGGTIFGSDGVPASSNVSQPVSHPANPQPAPIVAMPAQAPEKLAPDKAVLSKAATEETSKPAASVAAPISMKQKIADLKAEKKLEIIPDVSLITNIKLLKEEQPKVAAKGPNLTPTSQKTGLEYRTHGTPANPNDSKVPFFKAEDFMGEQVLGGKKPIDEKTVVTPELPDDVYDLSAMTVVGDNSEGSADFSGIPAETTSCTVINTSVNATATTTSINASINASGPALAESTNAGEFKVKIKRPKLKG